MITPPYLKPGDTIGLVSPSSFIESRILQMATHFLELSGFKCKTGKHALDRYYQFAGKDSDRAADLQEMLDDPEIRMIYCLRGGYGMIRIIDKLSFEKFLQQPKWIVGYSDITTIHMHLLNLFGVESIHGIMPYNFPQTDQPCPSVEKLFETLSGQPVEYRIASHHFNVQGVAEGILTGGNISIMTSLLGSISEPDTEGKILFLEEVNEKLYRLDRMMYTLKRSGKLSNLAGLIIGSLTEMSDTAERFGMNAEEIIREVIGEVDYPVCFGFPAGHDSNNYPLIIGRKVVLEINNEFARIKFQTI